MSLALEYRPSKLNQVYGNESVIKSLKSKLKQDKSKMPHCILFAGPSGCGKTTIAQIVAYHIGYSPSELYVVNSANFRGIDTVRELSKKVKYLPMSGDTRIWVFNEVHKWTNDAQNAMLDLMENLPKHVYFFLTTTDPQKLLTAVKNRCTTYEMKLLDEEEMSGLLSYVVEQESAKVPEKIIRKIAIESKGSPREALQILERVINLAEKDMEEAARQLTETETVAIDLARTLLNEKKQWKDVATILKGIQGEPEQIRQVVIGYMSKVLLGGKNKRAFLIYQCFSEPLHYNGMAGLIAYSYDVICGE